MADVPAVLHVPEIGVSVFSIGTSGQRLEFTDRVLSHVRRHRQTRCYHREAGGQLFATFSSTLIRVVAVTGPRPTDGRGRWHYHPDREAEQAEILSMHAAGLHYVGDWHTHPQQVPRPSSRDIASINDCFKKSKHSLNAFVMAIVGNGDFPQSFRVFLCDGEYVHPLSSSA